MTEPRIRRHPKARRIRLSLDRVTGDVVLTLPPGVPKSAGLAFARKQSRWIAHQRAQMPEAIPFIPGAVVPIHGHAMRLDHIPTMIGIHMEPESGRVIAGGPTHNFAKRFDAWIKAHARDHLCGRVRHFAKRVDRPVGRIRLGDTRSRWGSCSSTGTLSLSWRLVCAPRFVSDYVVAHEVAHLVELNHSARFWQVVEDLVGDPGQARQWLRKDGGALHRLGRDPTDQDQN